MTFAQLSKQIEQGQFAPIYLIYGAEPYFRDKLVRQLEDTVLQPHERDFNQDTLYGNDVKAAQLLGIAKSYPTMAQRRLLIVKEAHRINKNELDALAGYLKAPVETTVLVFVWPHKSKPDGRTAFGKTIMKAATVFESKPIYENKVPGWINEMLAAKGFSIAPDALQVVAQSLGTNLQLIESELEKILLHLRLQKQTQITRAMVHEFIAIDKDFNVFELQDALGKGESARAQT
ncbi:MAG: DNA polymerase III subunit delta, partial [Bacteroidota bacterium]